MTPSDSGPAPERLRSDVTAGRGGAMTDEVGVVTGDLTVLTSRRPDGLADIRIQYTGAEEWYSLTGSPAPLPPGGLDALHADVLRRIRHGEGAEAPR
ncbi:MULTISPECIES: hypothetical protein [Streptomyces]|uniref:Uncharacterized protein n=2 Tax=Streptomyces TaxID=1883 RepID=A0A3R7FI02_9ACTN|nr:MULTISPECIES: hypothetical protein [Streptomyces]KNE82510.1 hypothetical protein ADZ36_10805 [Streptomyces fradiae]OFA39185.1 hypothetical protein BEN35_27155 [Streptomyces fradiae]PQM22952.1 hypothetical protein Sfr7A_14900 [Streptomyces xinghaiensis]RKM97426.1 hypothetical protein SFRA_009505 [Streptomyces xinghaiensis]RNC73740.1 hypothetical protein DC095_012640 [Streptomyces xinghaiensis]